MTLVWHIRSVRFRLQRLSLRRLHYLIVRLWFAGLFYPMTLRGLRPRQLEFMPAPLWPGESGRGATLLRGEFTFCGETVDRSSSLWRPSDVSGPWLAELHSFGWLSDLRAIGGEASREYARGLVAEWIETQGRWRPLTWRPDVVSARIINWLCHAEFLFAGAEGPLGQRYLDSIARQARHLRRVVWLVEGGPDRLIVLHALILAGLCLRSDPRRQARWLSGLAAETDVQVAGDGGHVSRCPETQFDTFRRLVEIRAELHAANVDVP